MKTLAQFKRDISIGDNILLVEKRERQEGHEQLKIVPIPEKQNKMRFISYKDTTGFYLKGIDDTDTQKRGSFLGYPHSAHIQYDGSHFLISDYDKHGLYATRYYQVIK